MVTKKESNLVRRPRRKADSSVKGKLNRWEGSDYVEFVPTGTRESNRRMLKQLGNSSFYKSEGQKESSYSLHLNVDGDSENGKLVIMTELSCAPDIERQLLQAQAQMNVCIGRHRTEIMNNTNK